MMSSLRWYATAEISVYTTELHKSVLVFYRDWDDLKRELAYYVLHRSQLEDLDGAFILPFHPPTEGSGAAVDMTPADWAELEPSENVQKVSLCVKIVRPADLQGGAAQPEAFPLGEVFGATELAELKAMPFIGVNKGEDWSQVSFSRPYAYLYLDESEGTMKLACTDAAADPDYLVLRTEAEIKLPTRGPLLSRSSFKLTGNQSSLVVGDGSGSSEGLILSDRFLPAPVYLGEALPTPVPLLPEMVEQGRLLFRGTDKSRYWMSGFHFILRERQGLLIEYIPLVPVESYHVKATESQKASKNLCFETDPHGNIFVAHQFMLRRQGRRPCYCSSEQYPELRFINVDQDLFLARCNHEGKGGLIGRIPIDYSDVAKTLQPLDLAVTEKAEEKKEKA
jgi:hypothetical protein